MYNVKYHLKCNVPKFEQHRGYSDDLQGRQMAESDFFALQSQFEASGYKVSTRYRNEPLRGSIEVEVDGFYYHVELYKENEITEGYDKQNY